jgi:superfamily II DNA/RNA helicase
MPKFILEITESFMRNPAKILVKNEELTLDGIKQFYVPIDKEQFKFETLIELYKSLGIIIILYYYYYYFRNPTMYHLLQHQVGS